MKISRFLLIHCGRKECIKKYASEPKHASTEQISNDFVYKLQNYSKGPAKESDNDLYGLFNWK